MNNKEKAKIIHKRFRNRRRKNNICLQCGDPLDDKCSVCSKCRKKINGQRRLRRKKRIVNGQCSSCTNVAVKGKRHCARCIKNRSMCKKKMRKCRKEQGLCILCGQINNNSKNTCNNCLLSLRDRVGKLRKSRIKKGLCRECGAKAFKSSVYCLKHLLVHNQLRNQLNKQRRKLGQCVRCGDDAQGKYQCNECMVWFNDNYASPRRAKIKRGESIDRNKISQKTNNKCAYCGKKQLRVGQEIMHLDHVIPLTRGGKHLESNLILCCYQCNNSKFNKLLQNWRPDLIPKIEKLLKIKLDNAILEKS